MRHLNGASDGNRTHATSLEGWDSTIELHSLMPDSHRYLNIIPQPVFFVNRIFKKIFEIYFSFLHVKKRLLTKQAFRAIIKTPKFINKESL